MTGFMMAVETCHLAAVHLIQLRWLPYGGMGKPVSARGHLRQKRGSRILAGAASAVLLAVAAVTR